MGLLQPLAGLNPTGTRNESGAVLPLGVTTKRGKTHGVTLLETSRLGTEKEEAYEGL